MNFKNYSVTFFITKLNVFLISWKFSQKSSHPVFHSLWKIYFLFSSSHRERWRGDSICMRQNFFGALASDVQAMMNWAHTRALYYVLNVHMALFFHQIRWTRTLSGGKWWCVACIWWRKTSIMHVIPLMHCREWENSIFDAVALRIKRSEYEVGNE